MLILLLVPVLWAVLFYCILISTIQIKLNSMASQMIRPLQRLANRIFHAIRYRVASVADFILDAMRESMLLATKWTIYLCVAASCLIMGAALHTGLTTEMPPHSHLHSFINLTELQNLGVSLTFLSSLLGAICASPYPRAALVTPLMLALTLLGPHRALSHMSVLGPAGSQLGTFTHFSLLAFAVVLLQSVWRALPRSPVATAVIARLLGFAMAATSLLVAAVLANAVWLHLPWAMWLGMVLYICWVLVLFAAMQAESALCVGGCGLVLGLALMLPALQNVMAVGLRAWHFDELMFQPWVYAFKLTCGAVSWGVSMALSLVLSVCEGQWGKQAVQDWRTSMSGSWELVMRLRRGLQTWIKVLEAV